VRGELGIGEDETVFVAVGNARPEKGFEDLLAAASAMQQKGGQPAWRVLVAGKMDDGPYVEALRQQHSEASLQDSVLFLGFRSDVPALYAAADVFVLSSRSEGLPMVLLEAMTAGLPVVATRVGGVPEAVPQAAGVLVPPAEPDRLAEAMSALASDVDRRSAMGAAAREHALEQYGVERMAREYLDVFSRVVARRDGA
jgi:glycosyltransferase involved in cell wall biosynthesis